MFVCHALDAFANTLPTIAGNLIMGSHVVVFWAWLCLRIIETVDAHSGVRCEVFSLMNFNPIHCHILFD